MMYSTMSPYTKWYYLKRQRARETEQAAANGQPDPNASKQNDGQFIPN